MIKVNEDVTIDPNTRGVFVNCRVTLISDNQLSSFHIARYQHLVFLGCTIKSVLQLRLHDCTLLHTNVLLRCDSAAITRSSIDRLVVGKCDFLSVIQSDITQIHLNDPQNRLLCTDGSIDKTEITSKL